MKTKQSRLLGTFVFSKLPKKLTTSRSFTVLTQILFQHNTAHFHKGEMPFFYSPQSDNQTMTIAKRNWTFYTLVSLDSKGSVQRLNGQIQLKSI